MKGKELHKIHKYVGQCGDHIPWPIPGSVSAIAESGVIPPVAVDAKEIAKNCRRCY